MARDKVYMNEAPPADWYERFLREHFDRRFGIRPLDGTNLEWVYARESKPESEFPRQFNEWYFGDGDGTRY